MHALAESAESLSVPHSVSQSACVIIILICNLKTLSICFFKLVWLAKPEGTSLLQKLSISVNYNSQCFIVQATESCIECVQRLFKSKNI